MSIEFYEKERLMNNTMEFDEAREKIAFETYMLKEGYIKVNDKWVLVEYPHKDPKSYKEALPGKG